MLLDDDQVAAVGEGAKRFPVAATINGYTWRSTVVRMRGEFMLGLSKEVRGNARVDAGDQVQVELELDLAQRTVEVPRALADALARDPEASAAYRGWPTPTARSSPAGSRRPSGRRLGSGGSPKRSKCSGPAKLAADARESRPARGWLARGRGLKPPYQPPS